MKTGLFQTVDAAQGSGRFGGSAQWVHSGQMRGDVVQSPISAAFLSLNSGGIFSRLRARENPAKAMKGRNFSGCPVQFNFVLFDHSPR